MWSIIVREPNGSVWRIVVDGEEENVRKMYEDYRNDPVNRKNEVTLAREQPDPILN